MFQETNGLTIIEVFDVMRNYVSTLCVLQDETDSGMHYLSDEDKIKMHVNLREDIEKLRKFFEIDKIK